MTGLRNKSCFVKRFLIIQTAFLGDVILATPLVEELKRLFPDAQIDVLVKKGNESLLSSHPKINRVYLLDKSKGKWKNIYQLIRSFRKNHYDLLINLHRFASSGIIAVLSGAKQIVGYDKNPLSFLYSKKFLHLLDGRHEVERNLSLISHLGATSKRRPQLYPSLSDYQKVQAYQTQKYYCLAPASVWFTKQLPKEQWVTLIQHLPSDSTLYLVGGKGDAALCEEIRVLATCDNVQNIAGELNLLQSAALFEKATWNYVNDSGPLHLCSSVNAKVTVFFCSTVPKFGFGPLSEQAEIAEIKEQLYCRPCGLHGYKSCPEKHFRCGKEIDVLSFLH